MAISKELASQIPADILYNSKCAMYTKSTASTGRISFQVTRKPHSKDQPAYKLPVNTYLIVCPDGQSRQFKLPGIYISEPEYFGEWEDTTELAIAAQRASELEAKLQKAIADGKDPNTIKASRPRTAKPKDQDTKSSNELRNAEILLAEMLLAGLTKPTGGK